MPGIDPSRPFRPLNIAVLTVSDSRSAAEDRSGDLLAERVISAGHRLAARAIVTDERALIRAQLAQWCADAGIDVVISTGGTGITGRDVTVEAHRDIYEKEIEAFGPIFAMVSMETVGTSAMQSRATGGVAQGTVLFALPGSTGACRDAWDRILGEQLDSRHGPCNLVTLLPRLEEHRR
ncbi:MAG: molybdenum cofactor biosynthesis protein B [Rubellimicrobium sp.]|nr:molybdenum cofactor biosynthesis protein B [Rubellimicrobium sp.]